MPALVRQSKESQLESKSLEDLFCGLATDKNFISIPAGPPAGLKRDTKFEPNYDAKDLLLSRDEIIATRIPDYADANEPSTVLLSLKHTKDQLLSISGFPEPLEPLSEKKYEVKPIEGIGMGIFATEDIAIGETIIRERPLLVYPVALPIDESGWPKTFHETAADLMTEDAKLAFFDLHNCHGEAKPEATGIIATNGLEIGELPGYQGPYGAVCKEISRANHSCSNNAIFSWDMLSFTEELRAVRAIGKGEEICISYGGHYQSHPRASRQTNLLMYNFTCNCPTCALPEEESKKSDAQRAIIQKTAEKDLDGFNLNGDLDILLWCMDHSQPKDKIIKRCLTMLDMMDQEGIYPECWLYYSKLCKAYCALEDADNARLWAKKAAARMRGEHGCDGGFDAVAEKPEETMCWGLRTLPSESTSKEGM